MTPQEKYRERRREACRKLFEDFELDDTGCRDKPRLHAILEMARDGYYTKEIAEKLGVTPKTVQKTFRRYNFPDLHNFCPPQEKERHDWKHGHKWVNGYLYVKAKLHPHASKHGGYVPEHRLVMEQKLGRYLTRQEVVDHIDGDTTNNHPENLRVFANNAEHLKQTLKGRCPKWSEEGKIALDKARRDRWKKWRAQQKSLEAAATRD